MKIIVGTFLLMAACVTPVVGAAAQSDAVSSQTGQAAGESGVTPAALQGLLPASLPGGFSRISAQSGIKQSAPGAIGMYESRAGENDDDTRRLELLIYDIAAMDNPRDYTVRERVLFELEADSASETRETTLAGHPAFEEPRDEVQQEMLVLVGERLVVEVSSKTLGNNALREVLSVLDWERIAELASPSDAQ